LNSKRFLQALLLAASLLVPAGLFQAGAQQLQPSLPPARMGSPSLWHVQGAAGEVYLLGSVHVLPPNLNWRTPSINRGLMRADVFVFEVPQDDAAVAELQALIQQRGFLPPGMSLRAMLRPETRADYDALVADSGLSAAELDRQRPWLAGIQMLFSQMRKLRYAANSGVDSVLGAMAAKDKKPVRYLETIQEQFALLAPEDRKLELQEFEAGLKDLRDLGTELEPMIKAWSNGDQAELDRLINGSLKDYPAARKELLDDRNANWLPKIQAMLKEKHVFFIAVGAGHLTGPKGVPALLRKAGYKVDGP
jgi:uncharacterized protein YbaP (TraB family)